MGTGPDVDHLVDGGSEWDRGSGHARDPGTPHPAGDHDRVRSDVAPVRANPSDLAILDVDPYELGARRDHQRPDLLRALTHQGSRLERVHDPDPGRVEAAQDHVLVDEGDELTNLSRREQLDRLHAPRLRGRDPSLQLLHPLRRARDLDPAALGEDPQLLVLGDALHGESRHLLRMVDEIDEIRGVPGGAAGAGKRSLVEQHYVSPAKATQVVGHAVAHDPGADHDHARCLGQSRHESASFCREPRRPAALRVR